ncbi:DUF6542 domain-containing protein [Actinoalloteichus spitiensis]|uniref:DUF6542 domain-containing protein n=1 Tax=Actinoalloteichus spitiensis TaxID=252394 RepID=UPI0012F6A265|nr:DUF6542 domain-containing protein [Actinoalloteichus spitiensis]
MTAARDRERARDSEPEVAAVPWDERAAFGTARGLPWWAALLLAAGLTGIGLFLDIEVMSGGPGVLLWAGYILGCLLAVALVRRRNLFGPTVQPPLILAVVMPLVIWLTGGAGGSGLAGMAFSLGWPLINGFPLMAVTSALTVAAGLARYFLLQRRPANAESDAAEPGPRKKARPDSAARTSARDGASSSDRASRGARGKSGRPAGRETTSSSRSGGKGGAPRSGSGRSGTAGKPSGSSRRSGRDGDPADRPRSRPRKGAEGRSSDARRRPPRPRDEDLD